MVDFMKLLKKNGVSLANCKEIHFSIPHFDYSEDKIVGYTMQINYLFLESLIPNIEEIFFDISKREVNKKLAEYMLLIYELYVSESASKYIRIYALTLEMIGLLYDCLSDGKKKYFNRKDKKISGDYIHQIIVKIFICIVWLINFGFSREYFARMFKRELGISFKQYLIKYRLNQSLDLLKNTKKNSCRKFRCV